MLHHMCIAMTVHKCTGDSRVYRRSTTAIDADLRQRSRPCYTRKHAAWTLVAWLSRVGKKPVQKSCATFRHAVRRLLRTGNPGSRV